MILLLKRSVLGECYRGGRANLVDHYVTQHHIQFGSYYRMPGDALCGNVKADCLADTGSPHAAVCTVCARRAYGLSERFDDVVVDDES